jgi:hypothetical protein
MQRCMKDRRENIGFATSHSKNPSHTSQAYSNVGLMKVRYIFDRVSLERVNFIFLRTLGTFVL